MIGLARRASGIAVAATLLALTLAVAPAPASATARPIGACTTSSGVILAVDFGHWRGPLLRACGTTPTTGYELLNQGGWHTAGDNHDGPAFICRIGFAGYHGGTQYPTAKTDACIVTPPASAYWSYWHADPGQNSWSYSQLGAMGYHPKAGSVDLWIFGATNIAGTEGVPTISPDSVRAHNTEPAGGNAPKPTPTHAPTTTSPRQGNAPAPRGSTSTSSLPTPSAGSALDGLPLWGPPPSAGRSIVDVGPVADAAQPGHGSSTPAIVALVIVILLGAAGAVVALRRPRSED